ncbi:hypothetical protein [Pontibacillus marinus]|uniref:Small, acid-soluble spore protein N n=1 Tax=Pontibacillus marinus BH030004 = DSM 16465 TaxID=1385511 RepID=A0A0A5FYF4_9BACI|nr:hypothetical protein [Pontibacillus marinus]KGX83835.1 hypothetical protein N783_21470 [Pontibacillus marinus BH030004 = DSM 16465]
MPHHKNKQQAFQAAQQGYEQAEKANKQRIEAINRADYGKELGHLTQEVNEAYQQIDKALGVASEHQEKQLKQYQEKLNQIMSEIEE